MPPLDTDRLFYELFRARPEWLGDLTGLPVSAGSVVSSPVLKQLEIRCDLLIEPADSTDPDQAHFVVEIQLYHDHSAFNRVELESQIVWKHLNPREECRRRGYRPRRVEAVLIFGSRSELPSSHEAYPGVRVLFLDELIEALEAREPDSPLAAALAPLRDPLPELEKEAETHYRRIKNAKALRNDEREVLGEIFVNLLLQRFRTKSREEIQKMIAELTPLQETRAGRELFEEGIEKGIERGRVEGRVEGRAEGEFSLALRQLERKFPGIALSARPMVEALEEQALLAFGEELLFFESEEECLAWLERGRR